jgi:hypothetical protein
MRYPNAEALILCELLMNFLQGLKFARSVLRVATLKAGVDRIRRVAEDEVLCT